MEGGKEEDRNRWEEEKEEKRIVGGPKGEKR